ncbi:hypothetical protein INR49_014158 [Caranx melampygus]|nr:hypothetical protein INR49_014158 [Caranx melampygus]
MMRILCVVIAVLSLTSVSQSAPLTCEQLLKPLDQGQDFSGRWYFIALSSNGCFLPTLLDVFWPSVSFDITSTSKSNIYGGTYNIKMYGYCDNGTAYDFHGSNVVYDVDDESEKLQLLQSGCPDCVVMKGGDYITTLILLSRRQTITAAEMKEFETQINCLGWSKPVVFSMDHVYENCPEEPGPSEKETAELQDRIMKRWEKSGFEECVNETVGSFLKAACDWIQETWNDFWSFW